MILIGVVFDLGSLCSDGRKSVDVAKEILIKKMLDLGNETRMYVSHPDFSTIPRDQGESTFCLVMYKEPQKFRVAESFKKAVEIVGLHKEDCDKHIFLITDRFQAPNNAHYRQGFTINYIRDYKCKIHVFGIGSEYDKANLKFITEEYESVFNHLDMLGDKLGDINGN